MRSAATHVVELSIHLVDRRLIGAGAFRFLVDARFHLTNGDARVALEVSEIGELKKRAAELCATILNDNAKVEMCKPWRASCEDLR